MVFYLFCWLSLAGDLESFSKGNHCTCFREILYTNLVSAEIGSLKVKSPFTESNGLSTLVFGKIFPTLRTMTLKTFPITEKDGSHHHILDHYKKQREKKHLPQFQGNILGGTCRNALIFSNTY